MLYFFSLHIYFYSIRISNHVKICDLNLQCLLVNLWISTECSVGNGCIMSRLRWFISFVAVFRCPLISLITLRIYLVSVSISICLFQQIWLDIKPLKISLSKTESTRYIFFGHYSSYRAVYIYLFLTLRVETAIWLSPAVIKIVPKGDTQREIKLPEMICLAQNCPSTCSICPQWVTLISLLIFMPCMIPSWLIYGFLYVRSWATYSEVARFNHNTFVSRQHFVFELSIEVINSGCIF